MHTRQCHLVREALMRGPAAGRYVHVKSRQLPRECLRLPRTPAGTDRTA